MFESQEVKGTGSYFYNRRQWVLVMRLGGGEQAGGTMEA